MHNEELLKYCFDEICKEEEVELVDFIPSNPRHRYIVCWKLTTCISVSSIAEKIELYVGFSHAFPYEYPDIYYIDTSYDFFPHIDYTSRKLCYIEDGTTIPTEHPVSILRECLKRAKCLIEKGAKRENLTDFQDELYSYWGSRFNSELAVEDNWLIYGGIPNKTQTLKIWTYKEPITIGKRLTHNLIIPEGGFDADFESFIRNKPGFRENEALFLNSVEIPYVPPYFITPKNIPIWIKDGEDLKLLERTLNKKRQLTIVFPLHQTIYFGGYYIPLQPINRNGFRKLSAYDELTKFEKKNKCLQRFVGKIYSLNRINQRTVGKVIKTRKYAVIGLGSVGSNLTYFLSGWPNTEFLLVDDEILQPENIGRHLLGIKYVQQSKVFSIEEFLRERRPETPIMSFNDSIENVLDCNIKEFNNCSAIFMCMGDCMSEQYVLSLVESGRLAVPIFILWLEPFAIAGHLVYINGSKMDKMMGKGTMLYKHNLIMSSEYIKRGASEFVNRDAGCNGAYALYSGNDVMLFLSAIYPTINNLVEQPSNSMCYRWVGNINVAKEKNIALISGVHIKGEITKLPL